MTMQLLPQNRRSTTLIGIYILFTITVAGCHPAGNTSNTTVAGKWSGYLPSGSGALCYTLLTLKKDSTMLATYYYASHGWATVRGTYSVHNNILVATNNGIHYEGKFHPYPKQSENTTNFQYSIADDKLTLVRADNKDTYVLENAQIK
jgi:hypothetical protein